MSLLANKQITKGWHFDSTSRKWVYGVYNSSGAVKKVFDEDGALYQEDTKLTASAAELNKLAGLTASTAELNKLAGSGVTADELEYLDASANGAVTRYTKEAIPIVAATTAQDMTIVIPAGSIIKNVWILVQTEEATGATKTVDIGVSGGDEDGFLNGVSVAAAGIVKGTLLNSGQTLGALMSVDEGGTGELVPEPYVCAADTTLCYTLGSDDFAELVATAIVEWVYIPYTSEPV